MFPRAERTSGRTPGTRTLLQWLQAATCALRSLAGRSSSATSRRSRRATVVHSDIVSSTRLLESAGADYPRVLVRHRALIADAVARRGGDFLSHAGDGTMAVFARADDAIVASVEAQRALAAERWPAGLVPRVRMGVHAGEIYEIDDEPVGLVINHGARIMSVAQPGQVMVSQAAAAEASTRDGGRRVAGLSMADAGWHALRDHAGPVRLHQVVADGLTVVLPDDGRRIDLTVSANDGAAVDARLDRTA